MLSLEFGWRSCEAASQAFEEVLRPLFMLHAH